MISVDETTFKAVLARYRQALLKRESKFEVIVDEIPYEFYTKFAYYWLEHVSQRLGIKADIKKSYK